MSAALSFEPDEPQGSGLPGGQGGPDETEGIPQGLYVTLPAAGHPGHASWFGNGTLLALHAALGMFLILAAIFVLVRSIMARNAAIIVTSAAGLVAILLAAFFGSGFTDKLTDGYSIGMALAFAVALACYAIGLFAAPTGKAVGDAGAPRL